jgi:transposase
MIQEIMDNEVASLLKIIAHLEARIVDLERMLGLNSGNSSKPPSSDGLKKPARVLSLREKGVRPSGGQAGHQGTTLKMVETPDEIITHIPTECEVCGANIATDAPILAEKRQIFDLAPPKIIITEHRIYRFLCGCGHQTRGIYPREITNATQYGARIQAAIAYLNVAQLIPEDRLQEIMSDLFGVKPATATIAAIINRKAASFTPVCAAIEAKLQQVPLKHLDETGFRVGGKTQWLHSLSNDALTHYRVDEKRGKMPQNLTKTVVHDHWKPYFTLKNVTHALCNAHILRELKAVLEIDHERWAKRFSKLLLLFKSFKEKAIIAGENAINCEIMKRLSLIYDKIITRAIISHENMSPIEKLAPTKRGRKKRRIAHNLLLRLQGFKAEILRFSTDFNVPFTNNQAEQDIRMMKVKQKISGSFRTSQGAKNFITLRAIISTARKNHWNILKTLGDDPKYLKGKILAI